MYWRLRRDVYGGEGSNINTSWTVKCLGEISGMDEPVPWQQKQREGGVAETPEMTAPALFLDFPYHWKQDVHSGCQLINEELIIKRIQKLQRFFFFITYTFDSGSAW